VLRRVEDYRGRVIAIDASLSIYQFLVSHLTSLPSTALTPFRFDSSAVSCNCAIGLVLGYRAGTMGMGFWSMLAANAIG
jgi:hypothetical protein